MDTFTQASQRLSDRVLETTDWLFENHPLTLDSQTTSALISLRVLAREVEAMLKQMPDEQKRAVDLHIERWSSVLSRRAISRRENP